VVLVVRNSSWSWFGDSLFVGIVLRGLGRLLDVGIALVLLQPEEMRRGETGVNITTTTTMTSTIARRRRMILIDVVWSEMDDMGESEVACA